jgi:hypothetical protein
MDVGKPHNSYREQKHRYCMGSTRQQPDDCPLQGTALIDKGATVGAYDPEDMQEAKNAVNLVAKT